MGDRGHPWDIEWLGVRAIHGVAGAQQAPVEILGFTAHGATLCHSSPEGFVANRCLRLREPGPSAVVIMRESSDDRSDAGASNMRLKAGRTSIRHLAMPRVALLGILAVASGCQVTAPTASPSSPPTLGIDWGRTIGIERPPNFLETVAPDFQQVHPILRTWGQAILSDVTQAEGNLVAVGYVPPDWTPAAWTSSNGLDWAYRKMDSTAFTFPVAVTSGSGGTLVAVGRRMNDPVAWTSSDGATWQLHEVPVLGGTAAERMTAVVATDFGYVAGGSAGPELFERHARFWTSRDGSTWDPVPDDATAFADAEVTAISAFRNGYVAVGVLGNVQHHTGAVAWTSLDGLTWRRIDDNAFAGGVASSIIVAPFGGLLAVGSDVDRKAALAWISPDGEHWQRITARDYGDRRNLWMTDVAAIGDRVIAVGTSQATQRASATSWVSTDGISWEQAHTAPILEQVELLAVSAGGPGAVAVGVFGGPDSAVPTILLTPGSGDLKQP